MNMLYKDDTLYIDEINEDDILNINQIKKRMFSVLNQYQVDNVVINLKNSYKLEKNIYNELVDDYHKNYKGNLIIDIK